MRLMTKACGLLLLLSICLSSCKKFEDFDAIEGVDYSGEMAIALLHGSVSLKDLMDEGDIEDDLSSLIINPDGTMKLVYENSQISERIADLYDPLPSFPLVIPQNDIEAEVSLFEDMEVQEMQLKNGTISFELQSTIPEDVDVIITLPNLSKNGVVFSRNATINYTGNIPSEGTLSPIDLTGYTLSLTNNMMRLQYQAFDSNGNDVQLPPIVGMAENWDYDFIKGGWATETFEISNDTLQLEIYDNWVEGDITFADPRLSLVIDNNFGFPTQANITELKVITTTGESMLLESQAFANGVALNYPTLSEVGQTKQTIIELNNTNSNIADILNSKPQQIIYKINAVINPDNNTSATGFMTDESELSLALLTELPVHGTMSGFKMEEPIETDLNDLNNIESAEFKLIIGNGMPIEAGIQLYFLDEFGNKIDSLYDDYQHIVRSGEINSDGLVTKVTETISLVEISAERMEKIKTSASMLIGARFSTTDGGNTPVQIITNNEISIKAGLKVRLTE